jgi:hypothetical protein
MGDVIFDSHDRSRRLGQRATVGPLTLQAPEKPLAEWRRCDPRSLDAIEKFESWPIIVQGMTCAVARHKADREASQVAPCSCVTYNRVRSDKSAVGHETAQNDSPDPLLPGSGVTRGTPYNVRVIGRSLPVRLAI